MQRIEKILAMLEADDTDSFLQHALALEYIKIGKLENAKMRFEKLLRENENYTGSYYQLAKIYEGEGDDHEAIRVYEKGMERAKAAGDTLSYNEMKSAYEELIY